MSSKMRGLEPPSFLKLVDKSDLSTGAMFRFCKCDMSLTIELLAHVESIGNEARVVEHRDRKL